jgi:GNAT superfamily N-acetyltransferase
LITYLPYDDAVHRATFFELTVELLQWYVEQIHTWHQIDAVAMIGRTVEEFVEQGLDDFTHIDPTTGILYLVTTDEQAVGMGAVTQLEANVGVIQRMYLRPAYRGRGYGKRLLQQLITTARALGYSRLRLETSDFSTTAHHLYRSAGFTDIEEYPGVETPEWLRPYCTYMEKRLFP